MFCVDDDDEYMNAAAAHAAFVMTVSASRMYWLLRHAQHPLPEKIGLGSADFLHSGSPLLYYIRATNSHHNALTLENWFTILTKVLFLNIYYCTTM